MEAKLSSKGQVVVPKPLRDALGLDAGQTLVFRLEGRSMVVEPKRPGKTGRIADAFGLLPKPERALSVREMDAAVDAMFRKPQP